MIRGSIHKTKNGKATGPTGAVREIVKPAGKARVDIITNLVNQIIVGVIPAKWEPSNIVNYL